MIRVLNVNISLDPITGAGTAERTFQMSRFLTKVGASCAILTTNIGLTTERVRMLEDVEILAFPCLWERFYIPKFSYKSIRGLVARVDIVHLMGHWSFLNVLVYFVARRLAKPYVVCPAGALPIYGRSKVLKRFYNWAIGKRIIRNACRCIAIADSEIWYMQDYGVPLDKIEIIRNGISLDDIPVQNSSAFLAMYGLERARLILFVGRLNHIKGPDLLIRAFCNQKDALRDYHLVFVGPDGGMLSELKELVNQCDAADKVHFLGYLGREEIFNAYCAADLLVIPSRQEAMSIVLLEAGVTGTPVMLTDRCGVSELAGVGGGLVVPASIEGLERGLIEILRDVQKLKSMGAKLQKYTFENFSWDVIVGKYLRLYHQILSGSQLAN